MDTMKKNYFSTLLLLFGLLCSLETGAQSVAETPYYPMLNWDTSPYKSYRFTSADKEWINFRLLFPNGYDSTAADGNRYPLIIVLHGGGESGRMQWNNSTKSNTPYPKDDPRRDNNDHHLLYGGKEHRDAVQKNRFPGFVLFPQNSYGTWVNGAGGAETSMYKELEKALDLLEYLIQELKVDPERVYIHGLSKGGVGCWYAAYKRPELFAAALPMSAPGDPAMADQLVDVPLWVFQGELDKSPSPAQTKRTIKAVQEAGGSVRYKEYKDRGHNTWNLAYNEPDFFEWMLGLTKNGLPPANMTPTVDAGEDINLSLPKNSVSLNAAAFDLDGSIASFLWEKTEGPEASMAGENTNTLQLSQLTAGTYTIKVTVTDNKGASATDLIKVIVKEESESGGDEDESGEDGNDEEENTPNQAPLVDAGKDSILLLPLEAYTLQGIALDEDGEITSLVWEKVSGPSLKITDENTPNAVLSGLEVGEYIIRFSATDNAGATSSDELTLIVKQNEDSPLHIHEDQPEKTLADIQVSAFPNPFTHFINIEIEASAAHSYRIYLLNAQGALLHKGGFEARPFGNNHYAIEVADEEDKKELYYVVVWSKEAGFKKVIMMIRE